MGDVKMLAMIGAFLGWQLTLVTLMMASFAGSIIGVALIATRRGGVTVPTATTRSPSRLTRSRVTSMTHLVAVPSNVHALTLRSPTIPRAGTWAVPADSCSAEADRPLVSAPMAVDAPPSSDIASVAAMIDFFMPFSFMSAAPHYPHPAPDKLNNR